VDWTARTPDQRRCPPVSLTTISSPLVPSGVDRLFDTVSVTVRTTGGPVAGAANPDPVATAISAVVTSASPEAPILRRREPPVGRGCART